MPQDYAQRNLNFLDLNSDNLILTSGCLLTIETTPIGDYQQTVFELLEHIIDTTHF